MTTDTTHPLEVARAEAMRGNPNDRAWMRSMIARTFGIRIDDSGRLEAAEDAELLALHRTATKRQDWETTREPHYALSRLSKDELRRWRELVSKAAGRPGLLDELDEDGRLTAKVRELVGRAERTTRSKVEEPGSVRLPAFVHDWLVATPEPILLAEHLAILVAVLSSLENGRTVFRSGYVEGEGNGRTLVIPNGVALGRLDPAGEISLHFARTLKHLAANELITLEEGGGQRRIGYGPRMLALFEQDHVEAPA